MLDPDEPLDFLNPLLAEDSLLLKLNLLAFQVLELAHQLVVLIFFAVKLFLQASVKILHDELQKLGILVVLLVYSVGHLVHGLSMALYHLLELVALQL